MDRQRNKSRDGSRERKPKRAKAPEPILIVARRPGAPAPPRRPVRRRFTGAPPIAAPLPASHATPPPVPRERASAPPPVRRSSRIVQADGKSDGAELERQKLLARLLASEGQGAITQAALRYREAGFDFPREQSVQIKLLEHRDEGEVCTALDILSELLEEQEPIQLRVFEQRLKRLEDAADDPSTRDRARQLRRALRA